MKNHRRCRGMSVSGVAFTLLLVALSGGRTVLGGPLDEYFKLEESMASAHEAFLQAQEAAAKNAKVNAPTSDVRPVILKRMDAMASKTIGTNDGAPIAMGAFFWSWSLDLDLDNLFQRFETVATHYAENPGIDDVLSQAVDAAVALKAADRWAAALDKLSQTAKRPQTKVGALLALGQLHLRVNRPSDAKGAFQRLIKAAPDKATAKLAKGYLFEVEHLQVGMPAPDFSTKTLDGKTVSLRSLRGKAVLLNFWASW